MSTAKLILRISREIRRSTTPIKTSAASPSKRNYISKTKRSPTPTKRNIYTNNNYSSTDLFIMPSHRSRNQATKKIDTYPDSKDFKSETVCSYKPGMHLLFANISIRGSIKKKLFGGKDEESDTRMKTVSTCDINKQNTRERFSTESDLKIKIEKETKKRQELNEINNLKINLSSKKAISNHPVNSRTFEKRLSITPDKAYVIRKPCENNIKFKRNGSADLSLKNQKESNDDMNTISSKGSNKNYNTSSSKTSKKNSVKPYNLKQIMESIEEEPHQTTTQRKIAEIKKNVIGLHSHSLVGYLDINTPKTNQDALFIQKNFLCNHLYYFLGVCDGHGEIGHRVSNYVSSNLPKILANSLIEMSSNDFKILSPILQAKIKSSFSALNSQIINNPSMDCSLSGSTCTSLIVTDNELIACNVGDSRIVLGKFSSLTKHFFSEELSHDHKPENKQEKERIIANGGRVEQLKDMNGNYIGPFRMWMKEYNTPGLAMSRSFGDKVAARIGSICEPEITIHSFTEEDRFVILASDGIWEFISSSECVKIVGEYYQRKDINGAVKKICDIAKKRWIKEEDSSDDITCIIVFFNSEK